MIRQPIGLRAMHSSKVNQYQYVCSQRASGATDVVEVKPYKHYSNMPNSDR
jgi:hypothetical protein